MDNLAHAYMFPMDNYSGEMHLNIGTGEDIKIVELVDLIAKVVGFEGRIVNDLSKPDGTPKKLLDIGRIKGLGWTASIGLEEGVRSTYEWFLENLEIIRR